MPDEYISREAALKYIKSEQCRTCSDIGLCGNCAVLVAVKLLEKVPAADAAQVVHGQWSVSKIRSIETVFYCSECKRTVTVGNDFFGEAPKNVSAAYPYCHCGAKMDGGNDDATD